MPTRSPAAIPPPRTTPSTSTTPACVAHAAALAAGLTARGVGPGDRVALDLPNSVDFLVAALACMWVGAMFIPLAVSDPRARVAAIIADCDPRLVLTTRRPRADPHPLSATIAAVRDRRRRAAGARRSGRPGGVRDLHVGHHRAPEGRRHRTGRVRRRGRPHGRATSEWTTTTRALCVSPFHFDGSFGTLFPAVVAGGALVIPPRDSLLFARFFFRDLTREQITHTGFSSTYLRLLLASPHLDAFTATPPLTVALGGEACSGGRRRPAVGGQARTPGCSTDTVRPRRRSR